MHIDDLDSYIAATKAEIRARETKVTFETTLEFIRRFESPILKMVDDCGISFAVSHINAFFVDRFPVSDGAKTKAMIGMRSFTKALRDLSAEKTKKSEENTNAPAENTQADTAPLKKARGKSEAATGAAPSEPAGKASGQQSLGIP